MSRILVIDDEVLLCRLLRMMLERAGHTVFDAPDGQKGMELWHRAPTDIVVVDIFMPGKDGFEVIRDMQSVAAKPKIIAMSGRGGNDPFDWSSSALALGADRVLLKPFDQRTFLLTVHEVLNGQSDTKDAVLPSRATDQRKHPRFSLCHPVLFGDDIIAGTGTIVDISREGGRIICTGDVPGLKYFWTKIQFNYPHDTLTVDLTVRRWSRSGEFGVEFIRMEPDQQARLRSVIHTCEEAGGSQDHQPVHVIKLAESAEGHA